jgi:hypothetical protein
MKRSHPDDVANYSPKAPRNDQLFPATGSVLANQDLLSVIMTYLDSASLENCLSVDSQFRQEVLYRLRHYPSARSAAMCHAIEMGQLHLLLQLHPICSINDILHELQWCMEVCIQRGDISMLQVLKDKFDLSASEIRQYGHKCILYAAKKNDVRMLQYLRDTFELDRDDVQRDDSEVLMEVCSLGWVESLRELHLGYGLDSADMMESDNLALRNAAKHGHVLVLHYLRHSVGLDRSDAADMDDDALRGAAEAGRLEVVRFLHRSFGLVYCPEEAICAAARGGHLSVVQYLVENFRVTVYKISKECIHDTIRNGHLTILQYLDEKLNFHWDDHWLWLCMVVAVQHGQLEILRWILSTFHVSSAEICTLGERSIIAVAIREGQFSILKYLLEQGKPDSPFLRQAALMSACREGHLSMVRLLMNTFHLGNSDLEENLFDAACRGGHLELIRYFRTELGWTMLQMLDLQNANGSIFAVAGTGFDNRLPTSRRLETLQFLVEEFGLQPSDLTPTHKESLRSLAREAVIENQIDVFTWCIRMLDEIVQLPGITLLAIETGNLDLVKRVVGYEVLEEEESERKCLREAVDQAVHTHQTEIVRYLCEELELRPTIPESDWEYCVKRAVQDRNLTMLRLGQRHLGWGMRSVLSCLHHNNVSAEVLHFLRYQYGMSKSDLFEYDLFPYGIHLDIMRFLREHLGVDARDPHVRELFRRDPSEDTLLYFLHECGFSAADVRLDDNAILRWAARLGSTNTLRCLLYEFGLTAEDANSNGGEAIRIVEERDHVEARRCLLFEYGLIRKVWDDLFLPMTR